jgi:anti-sigma regulatory factor (Ser/Thr protein kinase)
MMPNSIKLHFEIPGDDFVLAGEASSNVKRTLTRLGINPASIKRTAIAMYEAEMNAAIHAGGGFAEVTINDEKIIVKIFDNGPGIPDINLAMQEGYSTASDEIREMGFGAGMGLPNIKKNVDKFQLESTAGKGTVLTIEVNFLI